MKYVFYTFSIVSSLILSVILSVASADQIGLRPFKSSSAMSDLCE